MGVRQKIFFTIFLGERIFSELIFHEIYIYKMNLIELSQPASMVFFLFYLLVASNYLCNLFSCKLQRSLNQASIFKHLLGVSILYISITLALFNNHQSPLTNILISFGVYLWFIVSTKMSPFYLMLLLMVIFFSYLINELGEYYTKDKDTPAYLKYKENLQLVAI